MEAFWMHSLGPEREPALNVSTAFEFVVRVCGQHRARPAPERHNVTPDSATSRKRDSQEIEDPDFCTFSLAIGN
jgi:hypothetical protein